MEATEKVKFRKRFSEVAIQYSEDKARQGSDSGWMTRVHGGTIIKEQHRPCL